MATQAQSGNDVPEVGKTSYPGDWHSYYGDKTGESARRVLPPLIEQFGAKSTLEVGCGQGHWSRAAAEAGVEDHHAFDGPWNDAGKLLIDPAHYTAADFSLPLPLERRYDLAICLEVAEHVREESAGVLVKSLVDAADVVLFGAAIPLQGGYGHINEQWPSYWRDIFARHGYLPYDLVRPRHWEDSAIHYWYRQNAFVYVNKANAEMSRIAQQAAGTGPIALFDAVHPEKFEVTADYRAMNLKRLARRLPALLVRRVRARLSLKGAK